jgi:hypothetical protein
LGDPSQGLSVPLVYFIFFSIDKTTIWYILSSVFWSPPHSLWARFFRRFSFLLARTFAVFRCSFQFNLSSKIRPNILLCLTISNKYSPIYIFRVGRDWTLGTPFVNPVSFAHFIILFADLCSSFSGLQGVHRLVYNTQSSAYLRILVGSSFLTHILAIATRLSVTLNTACCGTHSLCSRMSSSSCQSPPFRCGRSWNSSWSQAIGRQSSTGVVF